MKYFIGGVNASGKTTLLYKIKEYLPYFEIIKGSHELMTALNVGDDYEKLRLLPTQVKEDALAKVMNNVLSREDHLIVDAHYLNIVRGEIFPVTGDWIKGFDALLLMDISVDLAMERIKMDTRDRALFPSDIGVEAQYAMYGMYIEEYKKEFKNLCDKYNLPGYILNADLGADAACQQFLVFHETLINKKRPS